MPEINIGRLRGGFCVYWTDPVTGKRTRRQLEARTRKEAEPEALRVFRSATLATQPSGRTVSEIWEIYREDLGTRPTAKTMGYTGKAILPFFGAYEPSAITRQMCRDYAAERGAKGISQGSIWTELGHLSSAIKFAHASKLIEADTKIWRPQKPDHDFRILDRGEARALIDGTRDPHMRLAIVLLLGTAARVGAILDLTWDRVNLETGVINLRLPDSTTRKGRAIVPMNGSTRAALTAAYDAALTDYVIEYAGHQVKCIRTGFKAAARRAGIGDLRIHDLRHTAAVTMLSQGTAIEKVSQVLGHSSIAVTQKVYARYLPHHMQDATNLLDFGSIRRA